MFFKHNKLTNHQIIVVFFFFFCSILNLISCSLNNKPDKHNKKHTNVTISTLYLRHNLNKHKFKIQTIILHN